MTHIMTSKTGAQLTLPSPSSFLGLENFERPLPGTDEGGGILRLSDSPPYENFIKTTSDSGMTALQRTLFACGFFEPAILGMDLGEGIC